MLGLTTDLGFAVWMAAGATLALGGMALRQKLQDWREARLRGEWDSY